MTSALEALERLQAGNRRFVSGERRLDCVTGPTKLHTAESQNPFAVILGCSDSRVPVEIVFDQGPGDLFVIRVAGNVVAPSQVGSVEFAADLFDIHLVVVMGHTRCGAVQATLAELQKPDPHHSRYVRSIVDRIQPAIGDLVKSDLRRDPGALLREAVRANVRAAASQLRHGSEIIEQLARERGLLVVGAEYSLETGSVEFFDGVPARA